MALYLRAFLDETSTSPTTTSKISVRALEEMLARKAPLPWMSITYQFNRASTTIDKRNDDFIRSKWSTEWRSALLVHLRTAKAQDAAAWPPTRKLSFSEVYDLCTLTTAGQHSETENWTRDSDLALLKR